MRRWNGTSWVAMGGSANGGGISNNATDSLHPSIALDDHKLPIVAWEDGAGGSRQIYVKHWTGSSWAELGGSGQGGGISNTAHDSSHPTLSAGAGGLPIVAWTCDLGTGGNTEIYVRRWNGSSWVEMGTGSASGNGVSQTSGRSDQPQLAADSAGRAVLAWVDASGPGG